MRAEREVDLAKLIIALSPSKARSPELRRSWSLPMQILEAHPSGLNSEEPSHRSAKERRDDEAIEQRLRANGVQQDGKQEGGHDGADLGESGGEARALAADRRRKDLTREEIGLRVRTKIGHEVEKHEAGEDQQQLLAVREVGGERREEQASRTADEAPNLQGDPADDEGEDAWE